MDGKQTWHFSGKLLLWEWMLPLALTLSLTAVPIYGYAQLNEDSSNTAPNGVYLEFGGAGILFSINYERLVAEQIALRAGMTYPFGSVKFPVMATVLIEVAEEESFLELGVGSTFSAATFKRSFLIGTALIGFRYQPPGKKYFLRIALTPYTTPEHSEIMAVGFAFGFRFDDP